MDIEPGQRGGQPAPGPAAPRGLRSDAVVTGAAYLLLFLLGAGEGLVGAFYYSVGPVPLAAVAFALGIFATCLMGGWGMRRAAGALTPAIGWFAATLILSVGTPGGSVLITNSPAGKWFLFGGAGCVVAGTVAAFVIWSRSVPPRRRRLTSGR
ncbi:MAG: DUF6113 family protein [Streptosporangiaceae bacterium]